MQGTLEKKVEDLTAEISSLHDALEDALAKQQDTQSRFINTTAINSQLQSENDRLKVELAAANARAERKAAKVDELRHQARVNRTDRRWLQDSLDGLYREDERARRAEEEARRDRTHAHFQIGGIDINIWTSSPARGSKSPSGSPTKGDKRSRSDDEDGEDGEVAVVNAGSLGRTYQVQSHGTPDAPTPYNTPNAANNPTKRRLFDDE